MGTIKQYRCVRAKEICMREKRVTGFLLNARIWSKKKFFKPEPFGYWVCASTVIYGRIEVLHFSSLVNF